jgi:N-acetylglucosamine-6-phosphate deacetylase
MPAPRASAKHLLTRLSVSEPASYFDLQVNGAFGVDFNDDRLTAEEFHDSCRKLKATGVVGMLPTVITDSVEAMMRRIAKIARFTQEDDFLKGMVAGIHIEGPFLSTKTGYYGTHPAKHLLSANVDSMLRLLEAGNGLVRLVTIAPEVDFGAKVIHRLRKERVRVFAGHTDASHDELANAIDHGLVGFTHLGNGCCQQVDRQNNIIQRVLAQREHLMVSLIADGVHVPAWLLQSWIEIIGVDRCVIISDAMSAAGMPPGEYSIGGQPILVDAHRRTVHRDHQYLAGSTSNLCDMDTWIKANLRLSDNARKQILLTNAMALSH